MSALSAESLNESADTIHVNRAKRVAVSNLAGQSPHVRVQYESDGKWHRYASCRNTAHALACAQRLSHKGHRVRLVSFTIAPAAG